MGTLVFEAFPPELFPRLRAWAVAYECPPVRRGCSRFLLGAPLASAEPLEG